jgi:type I restriction enzyme S subunit
MSEIKKLIERLCPDGVEYKKLGELCDIKGRIGFRGYTRQDLVDESNGAISLSPSNIINGNLKFEKCTYVSWDKYYESPEIMAQEGDIVFTKTASVGKTALIKTLPKETTINPQLVLLKHIKCNNAFLSYFLKGDYFQNEVRKITGIGSVPNVPQSSLAAIEIPVPPIEVQSKIVEILDNFTELEAELEAQLEAELEARRKQYEYYRNQLLTFDKVGGARFDVKWMKMKDVCSLQRGKVYSKKYISENKGSYPVYSSQTANNGILGKINSYDYDGTYLTWTTDGAYAGTIFYREGKFNITNVCGLISISQDFLDLRFLYYWLSLTAKKYVYQGMGNQKLMSNQVEMIDIPILPIDEQKRIANILDRFEALTTDLQSGLPAEIEARRKQYEHYRNELLNFEIKIA